MKFSLGKVSFCGWKGAVGAIWGSLWWAGEGLGAFCQWKSEQTKANIAMPTEAQWHCLRQYVTEDKPDYLKTSANINLAHYASSCPVDEFSAGQFYDVIGNVWQWNESAIDGYEGFKVHPLYDDFSTPTFDGKHNLIKGFN